MKTTGLKFSKGQGVCEKCGCNAFDYVRYVDGAKEYSNVYRCRQCGAEIKQTQERLTYDDRQRTGAPQEVLPGAMKVIWREELQYDPFLDKGVTIVMAECPMCHKYPTYNELHCPFCGQALNYTEDAKNENNKARKKF